MNQAPSVFTPARGDGIVLPIVFSILVHGLAIILIGYWHQPPKLEQSPPIETTLVTPEQLAKLQDQILTNRAATQATADTALNQPNVTVEPSPPKSPIPSSATALAANQPPQLEREPVFIRSDDAPSNSATALTATEGILLSRDQKQALIKKQQAFRRNVEAASQKLDKKIQEDQEKIRQLKQDKAQRRQQKLEALKDIEQQRPIIKRPTRPEEDSEHHNDASSTKRIVIDFASEGAASASTTDSQDKNPPSPSSSANLGRPLSAYKNDIVSKIQGHFTPPLNSQDNAVSLLLKVDNRGNVRSARADSSNPELNKAAEAAAKAASPLPIDPDDPQKFSSIRVSIQIY